MQTYRALTISIIAAVAILGVIAYFQSERFDNRRAVETAIAFGDVLQNVPLTGEPAIAASAMDEHYAGFVTPDLLARWKENPESAPGRLTSSPWPDRIEVRASAPQGEGFAIEGDIVLTTSIEETEGGEAGRTPFVALVIPTNAGWRIAAFEIQRTE